MSRSWSPWIEWFAWHPVCIWNPATQQERYVWFRKVYRRSRSSYGPSGRMDNEHRYRLDVFDLLQYGDKDW